MGSRGRPLGKVVLGASLLAALLLAVEAGPRSAGAEVRISNLSVFLNDYDVTVSVVLFGICFLVTVVQFAVNRRREA